ncbi:MAG: hypothetical protein ACXAB4_03795, partial [Candidatus Hodarchaeales archaeon]
KDFAGEIVNTIAALLSETRQLKVLCRHSGCYPNPSRSTAINRLELFAHSRRTSGCKIGAAGKSSINHSTKSRLFSPITIRQLTD